MDGLLLILDKRSVGFVYDGRPYTLEQWTHSYVGERILLFTDSCHVIYDSRDERRCTDRGTTIVDAWKASPLSAPPCTTAQEQ